MKENFRIILYVTFIFQQLVDEVPLKKKLIDEVADYPLLHVSLFHTFQNIHYFFLSYNLLPRNSSLKMNKRHV